MEFEVYDNRAWHEDQVTRVKQSYAASQADAAWLRQAFTAGRTALGRRMAQLAALFSKADDRQPSGTMDPAPVTVEQKHHYLR